MSYETIDRHEAVTLFRDFMQPSKQMQVLHLMGDAKMGKSHLLTKVFPAIAKQEYQARYAILDLRNQTQTVPHFLQFVCSQLHDVTFEHYSTAYHEWLYRPKNVLLERVFALYSRITISAQDNNSDQPDRDLHLTTQIVKDLSKSNDKPLLLLFDTVDDATKCIQTWLNTLLIQLVPFHHIRAIIASRLSPNVSNSYAAFCQSYLLSPITEVDAYIAYCRNANIALEEQSIRDFAQAFRYTPGTFVDYVAPTFILQKVSHE